jgi:hypothetical protein
MSKLQIEGAPSRAFSESAAPAPALPDVRDSASFNKTLNDRSGNPPDESPHDPERIALTTLAENWNTLRGRDHIVSVDDLTRVVDAQDYSAEVKQAARFFLDDDHALARLDTAAEGGNPDGRISSRDLSARISELPLTDTERQTVTTLAQHWHPLRDGDNLVGRQDLADIAADPQAPPELRAAADYALQHPEFFDFRLDVAHEGGRPDGRISSRDLAEVLIPDLECYARQAPSEESQAYIASALSAIPPDAYADSPATRTAMAQAIAQQWHSDDPAARGAAAERLEGILATEQGRDLLAGQDVPFAARLEALEIIRTDSGWTGERLSAHDGNGWTHPEFATEMARARAQQFLDLRGDEPQVLAGTHLENTIGFAMGLPPQEIPPGETVAQMQVRESAVANGEYSYYSQGAAAETVNPVAAAIRDIGGDAPEVAVLPVQFSSPDSGPVQLPLFRVTDQNTGEARYVDNIGRQYDNFDDWRNNNKLPPGVMTFAADGHLSADANGQVRLVTENTPETPDTWHEHLFGFLDKAALVGGIVAGGVAIVMTAGVATPAVVAVGATAVGVGSSAWVAGRSGANLWDRAQHGQSINPFTNAEARGEWLNVGSSVVGLGAMGASARVANLARAGKTVSPLAATTAAALTVSANSLDALSMGDAGFTLLTQWYNLSGAERAQLGLSMAFWAGSAAAQTRMTGAGVRNMFDVSAMRDQLLWDSPVPVISDPELPGRTVQVHYDVENGLTRNIHIKAGPQATPQDIQLHNRTAQLMQRHSGLEGRLRSWIGQHGEPPVGSRAWEAQLEIDKLPRVIATYQQELGQADLSPVERTCIETDLASLESQLSQHRETLDAMDVNPGVGFVEARHINTTQGAALNARLSTLDEEAVDAFTEIDSYRQGQGLPVFDPQRGKDTGTVARIEVDGQVFYGLNSSFSQDSLDLRNRAFKVTKNQPLFSKAWKSWHGYFHKLEQTISIC